MTQERELEIEKRLSTLEEQMKRVLDNTSHWRSFFTQFMGGVTVALVVWWITKQ